MKKKHITKFILLFIVVSILLSVFSISVFAEAEETEDVDEEYTFWDDLALFGVLVLGAFLSPILTLANWLHQLFGFAPLI